MSTFSLNDHQLGVAEVHHNLPPSSFPFFFLLFSSSSPLLFSLHLLFSPPRVT